MPNSNGLFLLLTMLAIAITIITASFSFLEPNLSYTQTLGNIKDLSTDATDAHDPQVFVSGSNVYAIWVDFVTGNDDIYFKRSTDGGASFGDTINLSSNQGNSTNPEFSVNSPSSVYTVWQNQAGNNKTHDIFFKRSTDGGVSFGDTVDLSNDIGYSSDPDIASENNNSAYIVWTDNFMGRSKVFFRVIG